MVKISKQSIDNFFEAKEIAVVGVSRDPKKFGHQVYKFMKENSYHVYAVNPVADTILGDQCYKSVEDLPDTVKSILVLTKPAMTEQTVQSAIDKGIKNVWIQQMAQTPAAIEKANQAGLNLVYGKCVFMFTEPVAGPHKFHRALVKFFGCYPK